MTTSRQWLSDVRRIKKMKRSIIMALMVLATSISAFAQASIGSTTSTPEALMKNVGCGRDALTASAVIAANSRYEAALIASDTNALAMFLEPDFLFVTATGEIRDKQELLRSYGAKEVRLKVYRSENPRVRFYESIGIFIGDATKEGDYTAGPRAGTVFTGKYRITRIFTCRSDNWHLVSTHESPLIVSGSKM
jgi:ketosteroid isomerase-like protein